MRSLLALVAALAAAQAVYLPGVAPKTFLANEKVRLSGSRPGPRRGAPRAAARLAALAALAALVRTSLARPGEGPPPRRRSTIAGWIVCASIGGRWRPREGRANGAAVVVVVVIVVVAGPNGRAFWARRARLGRGVEST